MHTYRETCELPYQPQQLFNLVADVENYPAFLPWCQAARIRNHTKDAFEADVVIGYKGFSETYTSKVHLQFPTMITVEYIKGPFKHLHNQWIFQASQEGCKVEFVIEFEFKSSLFQKAMELFFQQAVHHLMTAFIKRAHELYGKE
jgi:coenzyme Q-binding protein COQ10